MAELMKIEVKLVNIEVPHRYYVCNDHLINNIAPNIRRYVCDLLPC